MSNDIKAELERLSQAKELAEIKRELGLNELISVYQYDSSDHYSHGFYSALIPNNKIENSLANLSWDLFHGDGIPGAVEYYEKGNRKVEYLRFGNDSDIEPLIIEREFHGIRLDYEEISEEFRLFHGLYHDRKEDCYYKIDDAGNEELIAVVGPRCIKIRLKEIRQFLAVKEMHLAIFFDCKEYSAHTLESLGLQKGGKDQRDGLMRWDLYYGDFSGGIKDHNTFSRLIGKRLIEPLPKEKSGFWGFAEKEQKKYQDFIIDVDKDGNEVVHNSDPDQLANYFGANPEAPHYLTPVHFRKEVLDKYYQKPGKYSVEDSILRCAYLWSMTMDNHHDDRVVAWLGDLGRDLPYEEQLHWRSYNIHPAGGPSETFIRRQLLAQWAKSERPEHLFPQRYEKLKDLCDKILGWPLLLPLTAEDGHHFRGIRVPSSDEQKDFDELVQSLTKVLIDSLNEKALNALIPQGQAGKIKGSISRLESVLRARGVSDFEPHIDFLRRLQDLRSSGAAHRKGSNYRKIADEFQVDSQNLRTVFAGILDKAVDSLNFMISTVQSCAFGGTSLHP
jgi:hypothetical protein